MKNLYILIFILLACNVGQTQTRSLNKFINHHKVQDNALAVSVPGWMLDLVGYGASFIEDQEEEVKELLRLSSKISKVRMLIIEEGADIKSKNVKKLIDGLHNEKFEELMTVHSEDADIRLLIKEKRNSIRNITAFVQSEDSLVLITLAGKFKLEDLKNLKIWDEARNEEDKEIKKVI